MDQYTTFADLAQFEGKDKDYTILYRPVDSPIAIMAPHGGGIEPGTTDIADALAGSEYTFYSFKGLKKSGNRLLHISSNVFDEPLGLTACRKALVVVSIHGAKGAAEAVRVGGKNRELKQKITEALRAAGFDAAISEEPGMRGIDPENICNRCRSAQGVQLEISRGLREKMFENLSLRSLRKKTAVFHKFIRALRELLDPLNRQGTRCGSPGAC